jgi:putative ABC transport system permease protein
MNLSESFTTAFEALISNKLRAVLTMLGVIIGVASVISLLAIGNGVTSQITGEIEAIGTNLVSVGTDNEVSEGYPVLTMRDVEALRDPLNVPSAEEIAASVQSNQEIVFEGTTVETTVYGVTPNYFGVNNITNLAAGDWLVERDMDNNTRVALLGATTAADLFGDAYPVGESIKMGGTTYEVIGVLAEEEDSITGSNNERVYIPLSTALSRIVRNNTRQGLPSVQSISVQAGADVTQTIDEITLTLRDLHGLEGDAEDDFTIFSQEQLLDTLSIITTSLTLFLGAIAGISLVVGGIGIMNIMLVSVTERTREIGIRKALGALRRDILTQFLIESLVLSLMGGFIGIGLGYVVTQIIAVVGNFDAVVDSGTVLLSTSFAAGVGLIFGIYPAWRASKLRPIEALRYE